ncbi:MAG: hypothetical protein PHD37_12840 [Gallionellaceae bacterium]|nr:hypothetical protein [Gallionellaceae bacterium]
MLSVIDHISPCLAHGQANASRLGISDSTIYRKRAKWRTTSPETRGAL